MKFLYTFTVYARLSKVSPQFGMPLDDIGRHMADFGFPDVKLEVEVPIADMRLTADNRLGEHELRILRDDLEREVKKRFSEIGPRVGPISVSTVNEVMR
jgi:hypothetical protein